MSESAPDQRLLQYRSLADPQPNIEIIEMKQTNIPKWKKGVGDINQLIEKANSFTGDSVTVACVRKIRAGHIGRGDFAHLDMFLTESGLTFPASILPDEQNGRWSK